MPQDTPDDPFDGTRPRRLWPPTSGPRADDPPADDAAADESREPARPARAADPEPTDPTASDEPTDPETTDPETTDPETTDPETTDPETTDPETTDPEATDPDSTSIRGLTPVAAAAPRTASRTASRGPARGATAVAAGTTDRGFGRTAAFTVLGTLVPGVGLLAAKRRRSGAIVLALFLLMVLALAAWAIFDRQSLMASAVSPDALHRITVVLLVVGALWVGVVVVSHLALRPRRPSRAHRVLGGLLVGLLAFAVAAPVAVAARISYVQAGTVNTIFKTETNTNSATRPTITAGTNKQDPWADIPRVNVLLLGGDAGSNRTGTRTDTVIVASIDTKTGDTVLFSLPRNTARMPFPANSPLSNYYPDGFTDGDGDNAEFFLNAMYDNVPATVPEDVLGRTDDLGADVMKISVGHALGLKIDYYALIDFNGFKQLVDALGGITVNINTYVAVGGVSDQNIPPERWLKPGASQKLDGTDALWFARGRYGADDFQRMDRQRCVINAIIDQANPANLLTRYERIAQAGKDIVQTDVPQEVLR